MIEVSLVQLAEVQNLVVTVDGKQVSSLLRSTDLASDLVRILRDLANTLDNADEAVYN